MNQDVRKFEELMRNDPEIQKKLVERAENYTGDKTDAKELFNEVILPVAKEAGLEATYEEMVEYINSLNLTPGDELSEDELQQIAGGYKNEWELRCAFIGYCSAPGTSNDDEAIGACLTLGVGLGWSD